MFVIPKKGLRVMDPRRMTVVPETGKKVSGNEAYWIRQANHGDIEIFDEKPEPKKVVAKKAQKVETAKGDFE